MTTYKSSAAAYIDPTSCGSVVGYRVSIDEYKPKTEDPQYSLDAHVELSDCNRKIEWSFSSDEDSLEKIDKAINVLRNFRKELIAATKLLKKLENKE